MATNTRSVADPEPLPLMNAAKELGLSYATARDCMLRGSIVGYQQHGRWFITRESVEHWIATNRQDDIDQ